LLDDDPGLNPSNNDLATLILKEYQKQVKWKSVTKPRTDSEPECDETIKEKIIRELERRDIRDELELQIEDFKPETVYTIQDKKNPDINYTGNNYDISPVLPASGQEKTLNVNSEAIHTLTKARLADNKDLVACTPWGKKFAQFTYIPEYQVKQLLGVLFDRTVAGASNTAYALWRAVSG
jgi:hypothetical protein